MKKALKLALIYLIFFILGTLLGTVLYSFYQNLLNYISGRDITFFNDNELFTSFFFVIFCMLLLMPGVVAYYRVRHPGGVLQLIVYIILCLITWIILFPCFFKLQEFCIRKFYSEEEVQYLTKDYFREVDDKVYYFTKDFSSEDGNTAQTSSVIINTTENGVVEYSTVKDYENLDLNRKAAPYREIQLKKIFEDDVNPLPIDYKVLITKVSEAYVGGLPYLITLLSFALLLCSVYGITNFFEWRLLNTVILFISYAAVLCFNSSYYLPVFADFKKTLSGISFLNAIGKIVSEPFLFIVNCAVALLFIITGIIRFAIRKHAAKAK